ncbi:hypothetical protein BDQ12DRAFT_649688 [Crucibulum laeve]|uniref:Uncharacterized protein n=1 Tax=Crucibulum laeve TaxID=68775 RepID=A0A5C3M531_9AGAR|nr:hypothetical protein BDQ12DRAFT_649688 [Crucibulum laeve]
MSRIHIPSTNNANDSGWIRLLTPGHVLIPTLVLLIYPSWTLPPFAPRQIIDSNDLFPLLSAPWSPPTSLSAFLSRLIQSVLLFHLPITTVGTCYLIWVFIALARSFVAYILTRGVGWACPWLFSHYSTYEVSAGFGPMLLAYCYLTGVPDILKLLSTQLDRRIGILPFLVGLCLTLCLLDQEPWTYAVTAVFTGGVVLFYNIIFHRSTSIRHPMVLDGSQAPNHVRMGSLVSAVVLSVLSISASYWLLSFRPDAPVHMPYAPLPPAPLLDILVLTFPRRNITASSVAMITTIDSYLPHLTPEVTLSVFTHSASHRAFQNAKEHFSHTNITFYTDTDSHPEAEQGQYLHAAEAFRWETEKRVDQQAEWVMLIEDDFPICGPGEKGWGAVERVMQILEAGRPKGSNIPTRRGGFVGTGGSGLIIHRTLLPVLSHLLRTYSDHIAQLPLNVPIRPADLVIQDCLLGSDPLCPAKQEGGLVITSRLVMDHIGGMISTNTHKPQNNDKWRCGWRHPFHGRKEVDVVVVDAHW